MVKRKIWLHNLIFNLIRKTRRVRAGYGFNAGIEKRFCNSLFIHKSFKIGHPRLQVATGSAYHLSTSSDCGAVSAAAEISGALCASSSAFTVSAAATVPFP